jgi:hypothetical protein
LIQGAFLCSIDRKRSGKRGACARWRSSHLHVKFFSTIFLVEKEHVETSIFDYQAREMQFDE